jgi:hypothetical protein
VLERIVYVSRAAPGLGLEVVLGIIRAAHARNAAAGITGGLVLLDGRFVQVLEGPAGATGALARRIARDPRHAEVGIRARERALVRLFPGQAMALRTQPWIDPGLLEAVGYVPGLPPAAFPADLLIEFVTRACRRPLPRPAAAGAQLDTGPGLS